MSVFKNLYQELTNNIIISVIIPYLILYLVLVVFPVFVVLLQHNSSICIEPQVSCSELI